MVGKLSWFPFFPSDWLGSTKVALMSPEQRSAFIDLLCHEWADPDCSLPASDLHLELLARVGGRWREIKAEILACFVPHPEKSGRIINQKLFEIRKAQEVKSKAAKKGWRKQNRSKTDARPRASSGSGNGISSSSEEEGSGEKKVALKLLEVWNEGRPDRNKSRWTEKRQKWVNGRLGDHFTEDQLIQAIRNVKTSAFHNGSNDSGWKATFEWIFKNTENVEKSLELTGPRRIEAPPSVCRECGGRGETPAGPCPGCPEGRARRRAMA